METINQIKSKIGQEKHFTRPANWTLPRLSFGQSYFKLIAKILLEAQGKEYQFEPLQGAITKLIHWTYDVENNQCPPQINKLKGILFKGHTGTGKTFLIETYRYWLEIDKPWYFEGGQEKRILPKIVSVKQIAGEYSLPDIGGYATIQKYANYSCLCLDDIGKERESKNYGNAVNVVEEIIAIREEKGLLTFGTTNLEKFSELYDDRTVSRINGLFNIIPINHGQDFRKL
ncbi:MAG: hypothetical protein AB7E36_14900 [Salinivirgaceae bacterium]